MRTLALVILLSGCSPFSSVSYRAQNAIVETPVIIPSIKREEQLKSILPELIDKKDQMKAESIIKEKTNEKEIDYKKKPTKKYSST